MAFQFASKSKQPAQRQSSPPLVERRVPSETGGASATRAFMESRFGHDFSQVRVHSDSRAAEPARAVNAVAGQGIGQQAPALRPSSPHHPLERQADEASDRMMKQIGDVARVSPSGQNGASAAPPEYGIDFADQAMAGLAPVQTKLNISAPGDTYEKEADRVAEEVVRLPGVIEREGRLQRACACGRGEEAETLQRSSIKLPPISSLNQPTVARLRLSDLTRSEPLQIPDEEIFPEESGVIQSKSAPGPGLKSSTDGGSAVVPTDLESTISRRCESSGEPLPPLTRAFLEPRFGHDFSRVRVHTDRPSGEIARQINARAFTLGNHIFFSPGAYQPQHRSGRKLLAHELTHVVQQGASGGPAPSTRIQRSEADSLALCPPYWRWETPRDAETFNCAGLSHRTYDFKSLAAARTALSTGRTVSCGSPCNKGEVKHWMWEFDTHVEDHTGRRLTATSHDFHTVAGVAFGDPAPQDPTDVYSTDGKRPVHGPASGPSFRPLAKEQVKMNDASERLVTDPAGNPVFWILYNYRTSCHCLPCPS